MFATIRHALGVRTGTVIAGLFKTIADNFALLEPSVRSSGAADYIPVLTDRVIARTRATAQTLTIPANADVAFDIGHEIEGIQYGAGALTVVAASGVTINVLATKTLVVAGQNGVVRLRKAGTNAWVASGDLTAA